MPRLTALAPTASAPQPEPDRVKGQPRAAERFRLRVAPSAIDGQGAFALEHIPARRKIGELRGEMIPVAEARRRIKGRARIHMVELSSKRAIDATESKDAVRYINHSCSPNAVLRISQGRAEFHALRDIEVGAEITVHYGETHHRGTLRCCCGAPNCSGSL